MTICGSQKRDEILPLTATRRVCGRRARGGGGGDHRSRSSSQWPPWGLQGWTSSSLRTPAIFTFNYGFIINIIQLLSGNGVILFILDKSFILQDDTDVRSKTIEIPFGRDRELFLNALYCVKTKDLGSSRITI